jgi:hypothetical protein
MRNFIVFILLSACTSSPPNGAPSTSQSGADSVPQGETEIAQAKFVVGVRTQTQGDLRHRFDDGSELVISQWAIVLSAVEVHLCEEAAWKRVFIGTANAHVSNSITRLGTPVAEDLLMGTGGAKVVGEIAPPIGNYCRAYAVFTGADDDVMNFTSFSDADLLGHTALIRGELLQPNMAPTPIEWAWDGVQVAPIALDAIPMVNPTDSFLLLVDKKVDATLLDGLSIDRVKSGQAVDDLMSALFSRVELYRSGAPQ